MRSHRSLLAALLVGLLALAATACEVGEFEGDPLLDDPGMDEPFIEEPGLDEG